MTQNDKRQTDKRQSDKRQNQQRQSDKPALFVVDGSNIATEGRSQPSLEQLNEAVDAFRSEYPDVNVTVVVDATFGHRIAKKEVKAFDKAVAANELVTPPAGAVGRGDAFILAIADKANAGVFSNDSFQELHGDYEWLFETGRLIGGKPVPHVGWVFVDRNPVRGRISRESIKAAKGAARSDASPTESKERAQRRVRKKSAAADGSDVSADVLADAVDSAAEASEPVGVEPDASGSTVTSESSELPITVRSGRRDSGRSGSTSVPKGQQINQPAAFFDFVEHHPTGSWVNGVVETYASHGAYARVGEVLVYIPLRLMAAPAPSSARKMLKLGDEIEIVIVAFVPDRLSIDGALPAMAPSATSAAQAGSEIELAGDDGGSDGDETTPTKQRASRRRSRKRGAAPVQSAANETPAEQAPKRQAAKKTTAKKTSAKKSAAKAPAKKLAARASAKGPAKAPAGRSSGESGNQGGQRTADQSPARNARAEQSHAAETPTARRPAQKSAAAKAPAKKAPAKKAPAKKGPAKKAPAKKAPAKKAAKAPAKQSASKRAAGGRRSTKKAAAGGGEASS